MSAEVSRKVKWRRLRRGATLPVLLILIWTGEALAGAKGGLFVSPWAVGGTLAQLSANGQLWSNLGASLGRALAGFALGSAAGVTLGLFMGLSRTADRLFGFSLNTLKQISVFAWIPFISIWFGLGETSKIVFIGFAVFFPVLFNTVEGVTSARRDLVELAKVLCLSSWQLVSKVILPGATPSIFAGVYSGLVIAWMATIGAEFLLTAGSGLGNILMDGRDNFRMDEVLIGVALVGGVGFAMHAVADLLEVRLLKWRPARTDTL